MPRAEAGSACRRWSEGAPALLQRVVDGLLVSLFVFGEDPYKSVHGLYDFWPFRIGLIFVTAAVGRIPVTQVAWEVIPFLLWAIAVLLLVSYIPGLALWLPALVIGP